MQTLEQIKKNYSLEVYNKNPKAVLVEYLQYEILDSIFKQKGSENLSFMGGTAIRIVYGSERFSEDLDFDNFGLSFDEFEKLFESVVSDMEAKGFDLEFRFVEKGAYHCYVKFPRLLVDNDLSEHEDEKILVRIDTVKKERLFSPEINILSGFNVYRKIQVNPKAVILVQKIMAVLERKRAKGRDFYDVSFLLDQIKPDYEYLEKFSGIKKANLKSEILKKVDTLDLPDLTRDTAPFLFDSSDQERILSFRQYIEQEL